MWDFQLPMEAATVHHYQSSIASSIEMSEVQAAISKAQIKADGNNQTQQNAKSS